MRITFFRAMMRKYWTPTRDEELKRHEAAGISASEIAALLHTTRSAVIGRSNRLRGSVFKSDAQRLKRQRIAASKKLKKERAHQDKFVAAMRADLASEKREKAGIFEAIRTDLAAGIDRNVLIKRALGAGVGRAAVAEFFGLSGNRVYQIAGQSPPRWTNEQVELLLSMWPGHSVGEIAQALGTTSGAVFSKSWRMGLHSQKSKIAESTSGHRRPRGRSGSGSRAAGSIRS
jgi:hypothetical protein